VALVGCGGDDDEEVAALTQQIAILEGQLNEAQQSDGTAGETPDGEPGDEAPPASTGGRLDSYARSRIAGLSDLEVGEPVRFDYPLQGQSSVLIKLGQPAAGGIGPDGDVVAFSELCTHMGCPIGNLFKREHGVIGPCACHFTTFDLTHRGMVVLGQATENLPQVILEVDGDDIFAVGVNGIIYGFRDNLADAPSV
jgi:arsenite oxidase small subunit